MFFDLQKAFDTVDHDILLSKLYNYGIRGTVWDWFKDYLNNRQQFVCIGYSQSSLHSIDCGVPQGSVLGPLLFLIYVNDICNCTHDCSIKLFADDTNAFIYDTCIVDLFSRANSVMQSMNNWFTANKLSLSLEKTCYTVFTNRKDITTDHKIKLGNHVICRIKHCKYLGVVLDEKLSWREHIEYLFAKLIKFTSIFYRLKHIVNKKVLQILYYSLIHPHLNYCVEIYANTSKTSLSKLNVLNNKLLRILQNKRLHTKINDLYISYQTLPIVELHRFKLINLAHECIYHINKISPIFTNLFTINSSIHSYNTRHNSQLHIQTVRTNNGKRSLKFKASQLWNKLPTKLQLTTSKSCFRNQLKKYLLHSLECYS